MKYVDNLSLFDFFFECEDQRKYGKLYRIFFIEVGKFFLFMNIFIDLSKIIFCLFY